MTINTSAWQEFHIICLDRYLGFVKGFLICCLVLLPIGVVAQCDTLVYRSYFEEQVFSDFLNKKEIDGLKLFIAHDGDSLIYNRARVELELFYEFLGPKIKKKGDKEKVKIIFNEVQKRFLNHYVDTAFFASVFRHSFNCVSGTALYALVLEHYVIPYEIRELPTHVYLVAYPKTLALTMESTSIKGYDPDDRTKKRMVSGLIARKKFTLEHVNSVGYIQAYNEYFFSKISLSLPNLAGLQYYNSCVSSSRRSDYRGAVQMIRKCDLFYPTERNEYFKIDLLENILSKSSLDSLDTFCYIADYTNSVNTEEVRNNTNGAFTSLIGRKLIKAPDEAFVRTVYRMLMKQVNDPGTRASIRQTFNSGFAYYHLMKSKYDSSLMYSTKVWEETPDDVAVQNYIVSATLSKVMGNPGIGTIAVLDTQSARFPFFRSNMQVRLGYVQGYATLVFTHFVGNREKEGQRYLGLMEQEIKALDDETARPEALIGYAYAEAGAYYYRQHNNSKSLEIMNRGLKYAPAHPEIMERIRIVKEDMR